MLKRFLDWIAPCRHGHDPHGAERMDYLSPDGSCGRFGFVYTIRCRRCGKRC